MNDILKSALDSGKVAGAYLIEGPTVESVAEQADGFLMRLFCAEGNGCGTCPGCVKYKSGTHVDMLVIDTDARSIKVDEVRGISSFVYRKAFECGWKAVYIPRADGMTDQAQNALLKVLEEPPPDTVFVLGATDAKKLLPTILSRCIILRTQKSDSSAVQRLMDACGLPTVKARVLLAVARNEYHLAHKYAGWGYFEIRADMMLVLGRILGARSMATSAMEKILLKYEDKLEDALAVMLLYMRDVLAYKYTRDARCVANSDVLAEVEKHARAQDAVLMSAFESISAYLRECAVCAGLNRKLRLTGVLFDILRVKLETGKVDIDT